MEDRWEELPQDVLEIVVDKLERASGLRAFLALRLVSKSWKAAVRAAFTGELEITINDSSSAAISRMCRLLPGMSALNIKTCGTSFDLSPVSALSRLVSVDLYNDSISPILMRADLESLPASLETLFLSGFHLRDVHLQHLKCVTLKNLECEITQETFDDTFRLLEALPSLKVISMARQLTSWAR